MLPIVALAVTLLVHVPPVTVLLNVVVEPIQTVAVPVIVPALGANDTVTVFVAAAVPQPVVFV